MSKGQLLTPNIKDLVTVARFCRFHGGVRCQNQGFYRFWLKRQQCAKRQAQSSALGEHRPAYRRWSYTNCRIADLLGTVPSADSSQVRRWLGESVCARVEPDLCTTGDQPRNCADADRSMTGIHSRPIRCGSEVTPFENGALSGAGLDFAQACSSGCRRTTHVALGSALW